MTIEAQSRPLLAAVYMSGAIACFSVMAIAGREVSGGLDSFEIMTFRSLIGVVIVFGLGFWFRTLHEIRFNRIGLHLVRNLFHFAGQNLWFYALALIPLAQVFALEFSYPLWVSLAAPFFLGERMTRVRLIAAIVGFLGILIVVRPGLIAISPGTLSAMLSAFGFAGAALCTKRLVRDQSITCILVWLTVMQSCLGLLFAGFDGDIALPSAAAWPWVVLIAFCGLGAHFCITTALSIAPAAVVAPMDFGRLPVIMIVAALLYGEAIDPFVVVGAAVIVAAIYTVIASESRRAAFPTS